MTDGDASSQSVTQDVVLPEIDVNTLPDRNRRHVSTQEKLNVHAATTLTTLCRSLSTYVLSVDRNAAADTALRYICLL